MSRELLRFGVPMKFWADGAVYGHSVYCMPNHLIYMFIDGAKHSISRIFTVDLKSNHYYVLSCFTS